MFLPSDRTEPRPGRLARPRNQVRGDGGFSLPFGSIRSMLHRSLRLHVQDGQGHLAVQLRGLPYKATVEDAKGERSSKG